MLCVAMMLCPYCGSDNSKVTDSRDVEQAIRRRRECLKCGRRFTTYERIQTVNLLVIKKDERREEFNREKLMLGIRRACEKRPMPDGTIERLVDDIEGELYQMGKAEIPTSTIGEMVMERLKALDQIAYIRFASVYRQFADIDSLKKEVDTLASGKSLPVAQLPLLPKETLVTPVGSKKRRSRRFRARIG